MLNLPNYVKTTMDLIDFSKCANALIKRPPRARHQEIPSPFPLFERTKGLLNTIKATS
ncbi:hypothetical protein HPSA20_1626 [Helicobacter pylori SouthAfrica20]|uniref:Uncharacterized protein n=1 Tax=Helicobacter pylori SouthAfrica20 TaxID=1352356 RepID=T1UEF2_HELPX|nr:hypothetical protein HPSA20_1626 [Helicobacter pylori SouthAfrica20]